jgi:DNA (cytosine-5)-methyltransferase 1
MTPLQIGDMFCGAGGSTTGIKQAVENLGRRCRVVAINHWDVAIETHFTNNADVEHICASVEQLDPTKVVPGRTLDLLWASPSCTHHSVARGGRPRCEQQRSPAWIILYWLENLRVKRLVIENVPEFQNWGPLDDEGRIIKEAKGETFRAFITGIRSLGYSVDWRVLNAADYGDPTVRRRLFIQAIRGTGRTITWPRETHVEPKNNTDGRPAWIPARDIIDWSIHGGSIFHRKKPLVPATLRRIEHGIERFWQPYAEPFLVMLRGTGTSRSVNMPLPAITAQGKHLGIDDPVPTITGGSPKAALIEPFITRFHGGQDSERRNHSIDDPLPVIDTSNRYGIIEPFLVNVCHKGNDNRVRIIDNPMSSILTITKNGHALIEPFLVKYYGTGIGAVPVDVPLGTITTKERFGLVEPGEDFLLDIRFRMLQPHEEAAAMSFPKDYVFRGTKGDIQKQIGNAVPVSLSRELAQNILSIEVV